MDRHKEVLFTPKYQGTRFEHHRFPLDLVEDLDTLRKMTIDLAKHIYLENNPDKKRIPKNFTEGISFELESIDKGSTIPKIVLMAGMTGLFPQHNLDYFTEAGKRIVEVIEKAEDPENKKFEIPDTVLFHFHHLGKKLLDDESIEFKPNDPAKKATFTKESRKRILLVASKNKEYSSDVFVKGLITAVDKLKQTFDIQLINGDKVKGCYLPEQQETIMEAFNKMENKQKISIKGDGILNINDKLITITEMAEINLLDAFDVATRLEELSLLEDGWLDGYGKAPDKQGLEWLAKTFDSNYDVENLPLPATFPTPEGNVQFEWSIGDFEISMEVELTRLRGVYHEYNTITKKDKFFYLNLKEEKKWFILNKLLYEKIK